MTHMKKTFQILNLILITVSLVNAVNYYLKGGLLFKGITSFSFALLGIVNLVYALCARGKSLGFPIGMATALVLSMIADVVINLYFIPGAVLFALAHVIYLAAYCELEPFQKKDLIPMGLIIVLCLGITNTPLFFIGDSTMKIVVTVYCIVISCMFGKAISNFLRKRSTLNLLLAVGCLLFWGSDLMLALELFAAGGKLANTLCLFSYFPGQTLLAHGIYHYTAMPSNFH